MALVGRHRSDELRRGDGPAQAPAGHGVRLGETVDGDGALAHAGQARRAEMRRIEDQRTIDLVGDEPEIVFAADLGEGFPFGTLDDGPRRIMGAVDHHCFRLRVHRGGDIGRLQAEAILGVQRYAGHRRAADPDGRLIGHIHGRGHDDLIARIKNAECRGKQRALGAGDDHDILRPHLLAAAFAMPARNGRAQRRIADDVGIVGAAPIQRGLGRGDDGRRRIEIRLAHGQDDDVLALAAAPHSFEMDGPSLRALAADSFGQMGKFHGAPI